MQSANIAGRPLPASGTKPPVRARTRGTDIKRVDKHLVSLVAPDTFEAEQYRRLRRLIEEARSATAAMVVSVCSPIEGDGKSVTAINLAGALAQADGSRVLLVDADLRRQSIAFRRLLGLRTSGDRGLSNAIADEHLSLARVTLELPEFNLSVVTAGDEALVPYEALNSGRFAALVHEARQNYDFVIFDVPPTIAVADSNLIEKWMDGELLVVAAHHTPRDMLEEALKLCDRRKLLGLVFNRSDQLPRRYYGYGYYRGRVPAARRLAPSLRSGAIIEIGTPGPQSSSRGAGDRA